jgi:hypothetical protein
MEEKLTFINCLTLCSVGLEVTITTPGIGKPDRMVTEPDTATGAIIINTTAADIRQYIVLHMEKVTQMVKRNIMRTINNQHRVKDNNNLALAHLTRNRIQT